jgi:hypothetical protein
MAYKKERDSKYTPFAQEQVNDLADLANLSKEEYRLLKVG